ncbi:DUF2589 domain-containing protein [Pedobacter sp. PAMC26386]|nr:DUF2589 domain-containing protein [Pedobacter sp. PAMC26386]
MNQLIGLEELISASLRDIAKAQAAFATEQTNLILENYFTKNKDTYTAITVRMDIDRSIAMPGVQSELEAVSVIEQMTTVFDVPLLTLVAVNSLAVNNVTLDFDLDISAINAAPSIKTEQSTGDKNIQLFVKIKKSPDLHKNADVTEQQNNEPSNRLKLAMQVGQLPLPKGVNTMIEAFSQVISPVTLAAK